MAEIDGGELIGRADDKAIEGEAGVERRGIAGIDGLFLTLLRRVFGNAEDDLEAGPVLAAGDGLDVAQQVVAHPVADYGVF